MNNRLEGKTALVTGASSGIGRATAVNLAKLGANVVIHARRENRLMELAAEIECFGGKVLIVPGDASRPSEIDDLMDRALMWDGGGRKVDIAVVNAGRGLAGSVLTSDTAKWEELFRLNVIGASHLMRRAAGHMMDRKAGDIVAVSSVVGRSISPFSSFYGSSKFAVSALAEGLRREVCVHGVRVSTVMPGIVVSEFQDVAGYDKDVFGKSAARFGTLLEPQDIADGISWLLTLPPHVNVSEIMIRPTGQDYP